MARVRARYAWSHSANSSTCRVGNCSIAFSISAIVVITICQQATEKKPSKSSIKKSGREDSNLRPLGPKTRGFYQPD